MAQLNIRLSSKLWAAAALQIVSLQQWPSTQKISGQKFGGISGIAIDGEKVFLLSDDRGKVGDPRFFEGTLKMRGDRPVIDVEKALKLSDVKGLKDKTVVLDTEGIVLLPNGKLAIASEADTNHRPREKNRILIFERDGKFVTEATVPEEFQTNPAGLQTKGSVNNAGWEGLTIDGNDLWTAVERPLVQATDGATLLSRWNVKENTLSFDKSWKLKLSPTVEGVREVFRGVSEILSLGGLEFLVLERSARVGDVGRLIAYGVELYLVNCVKDPCEKTLVMDLGKSKELAKVREDRPMANFEALAWGPTLPSGERILLIGSDNNFSSGESTEVIFLKWKR